MRVYIIERLFDKRASLMQRHRAKLKRRVGYFGHQRGQPTIVTTGKRGSRRQSMLGRMRFRPTSLMRFAKSMAR